MDICFIGQGLDPESDATAGNTVLYSLQSGQYTNFSAFVAFVSLGGLKNIIDQLLVFKENGGNIRLYLGVDLHATSKEALERLIELEIETYVVYSPNHIIYHPKIYAFEGDKEARTIIGSSNLTVSGLFQNIEASVCVSFERDDDQGKKFLADIYDHFNSVINIEHSSCRLLTPNVLEILVDSNVVLPEAVSMEKNNRINKEFGQKESKVNTKLLDLFGRLRPKRPPKGFRKTVVKKEFHKAEESSEINVVDENTHLEANALWIETGLMTGGSRNILDLSKTGSLDGVTKFGSVTYFDLMPDDYDMTKDVNVMFGGKIYKGNHIFYATGNQNWRIRLNGTTDDGERITALSKPSLGSNGGFQNKILVFSRIDNMNYKLEILEKEEMPGLIENSSDWAKGGRGGNGRAYGIIAE